MTGKISRIQSLQTDLCPRKTWKNPEPIQRAEPILQLSTAETWGRTALCWWAGPALGTVGRGEAPLVSTHQRRGAPHPRCDDHILCRHSPHHLGVQSRPGDKHRIVIMFTEQRKTALCKAELSQLEQAHLGSAYTGPQSPQRCLLSPLKNLIKRLSLCIMRVQRFTLSC